MEIKYLSIKNFKSIRHMEISDIQNALILVGKNNTGKSSILHALRAVEGSYEISLDDFNETMQNIEIGFILSITEEETQCGILKNYFPPASSYQYVPGNLPCTFPGCLCHS